MKCVALLSLLLVAIVYAQNEEYRCVTPPRWKGTFREIDYDSGNGRFVNVSYDEYIEAISVTEVERNSEPGPRFEAILEVFLFKDKKSYRVDLRTKECEEKDLTDEFRQFGVSKETEFNGVNYIGAEITGLGVKVDEYYRPDRSRGDFSGSFAPFGRECIPVIESYIHSAHGPPPASRSVNIARQFLNIAPVSSFPIDTFMKPPEC